MHNQAKISKEAQVLLKLIRLALGTEPIQYFGEPVYPFPKYIDWNEVIRLSYIQKVSAIAVDGLNKIKYDLYQGLDEKQKAELKTIIDKWYDDVKNTESGYLYYTDVLKTICQLFVENNLIPIVLKGYGLGLYYPMPSHRGAGDIDIYLLDQNGNCAAEKGDAILRDILKLNPINPQKNEQHHSTFQFKGITIENHHTLVSTFFNKSSDSHLREILHKLISKGYSKEDNSCIYLPSPEYNSVALIQHTYAHFYFEKITLRQLIDYALYTRNKSNVVNWKLVDEVLSDSGFNEFSDNINKLLSTILFSDSLFATNRIANDYHCKLILEDIFSKSISYQARNVLYFYQNRNKVKYLTERHWLIPAFKSIWLSAIYWIYHPIKCKMKQF